MSHPPTPPIELVGSASPPAVHPLGRHRVDVPDEVVGRLREVCASVTTDGTACVEASRDWWPLAMSWALDGVVAGLAAVVARPSTDDEVAAIAAVCNNARVPLTVAAGRSGVCGGSVPVHGGVVLDLTDLAGIRSIDRTSLVCDVRAGTFGDDLEAELGPAGFTVGHWPQSIALSTVGGWLACRSAGQLSNRYGKIEDIVVGLDVTLADGTTLTTGGGPRAAVGPDLTQLFVGSEGTLGIITGARLRLHHLPGGHDHRAMVFASFADGMAACRRILQRGATPAVLRLYDDVESARNFDVDAGHLLLVSDEADPLLVAATMAIVDQECAAGTPADPALVDRWLAHRNDVSALQPLLRAGLVVDTFEIAGPWAALDDIYAATIDAVRAVPGTLAVSAHQSHAYTDGACLYFTFAGKPDAVAGGADIVARERYYRAVWDAGTGAVLARGGALSHHHGVGVNRARFVRQALGAGADVLAGLKAALDPHGVLNPGKLGLPDAFADAAPDAAPGVWQDR
ncbi:MAG: FAD-binding oxidoreductase [Acidimicrobiales bacterium]|nr:FAD-binding oxidoreductase [Acidimicrobiales bacterium]